MSTFKRLNFVTEFVNFSIIQLAEAEIQVKFLLEDMKLVNSREQEPVIKNRITPLIEFLDELDDGLDRIIIKAMHLTTIVPEGFEPPERIIKDINNL